MMQFYYPHGATPLNLDEIEALIPKHIQTQNELNEWEQNNIVQAEQWAFARHHVNILSIDFIKLLHKKMFDQTWRWAGKFRSSNKNIGVDYPLISTKLHELLADVNYQLQHSIGYSDDECAYRFHHRLVAIHPFPNGNGRHARTMADILLVHIGQPRFSWGSKNLISESSTRKEYLAALRAADNHDYDLLAKFVRD